MLQPKFSPGRGPDVLRNSGRRMSGGKFVASISGDESLTNLTCSFFVADIGTQDGGVLFVLAMPNHPITLNDGPKE